MRILITGGAGFVGSNLAINLKIKNPEYEIITLDNLKRRGSELNLERLKKNKIDFIHGDIRNKEDLKEIGKIDLMIECSAEPSVLAGIDSSPEYLINTNLLGTINCLEEIRKNKAKIIFISTSRVYPIEKINTLNFQELESRFEITDSNDCRGISKKGVREEFPLDGLRSLYGTTKLCSELLIQEYLETFKLQGIINRCGIISGPWQMGKVDQGVMVLWVAKHIFNKELSYIGFGGEGKQVRDFIHIEDLAELINIQIKNFERFDKRIFNVGGGEENSFSLKELTKVCEEVTGNKIDIKKIEETRPADIKWFIMDSAKVKNETGWQQKKDLKETVEDITKWIYENKEKLEKILN